MTHHNLIFLSSDSPHIGEKCPVRHKPFQSGDSVIVCQQRGTVISLESVSYMGGHCPICGEYIDIPLPSRPEPPEPPYEPPPTKEPPYPTPRRRLPVGKWVIPIVAAVLLVGVCLGALGIRGLVRPRDDGATLTPIANVVEDRSASSPTDVPTPRPDPTKSPTPTREKEPTQTPRPEPTEFASRAEIEDLLERWKQVHHQADRTWDTSNLDTVLRGDALSQQRSTVESLKSRNCYWTIRDLAAPRITRFDVMNANRVVVEVDKSWDMDLYCSGNKSGDDDGPFTMWYNIERINGQWYITQKRVIDN